MAEPVVASIVVVMAQINTLVGDIDGNLGLILDSAEQAASQHGARMVVFPELTLTGYPPEDLLLRASVEIRVEKALRELQTRCERNPLLREMYLVVGYPRMRADGLYNTAGVLHQGRWIVEYDKHCLPNYQVFDEKRYFRAGDKPATFTIDGLTVALSICEDIWNAEPMQKAKAAGAGLLINLNASPFHIDKQRERIELVRARVAEGGMPVVYVNQVGGQDELVFDGGSFAMNADGSVAVQAPNFDAGLFPATLKIMNARCDVAAQAPVSPLSLQQSVYQALVVGVRDYVNKNGFKGVVLGLSGGIDSALTLAVAVDALGAERCEAVMMPFRYTADMSREDAALEAGLLGVRYSEIPIEPMFESFMAALSDSFKNTPRDKTEENLQARCRGVLLMAISNKKGYLVLTTGNKSEMAVGYSTLYGDMAGGFDVLKDVPKTLVFELARYRNTISDVIPDRVITRPPSAELAPDQKDEDSLPPYSVLDAILALYIEHDLSAQAIVARGFDEATVHRVIRMVDLNEYKRRQAPVGVRITRRGFGRDRRYPITSGWKAGE
jgi:NAD+ synthase (glutamine-hydrolysing)